MTRIKTTALAFAAMASLSALTALPQPAQAFGRSIAVGEFNPGRHRFEHVRHFHRFDRFNRFDRFGGFRRTGWGFRGHW